MIQFQYGAFSWEFSNPILGNEEKYDQHIVYGRSAGGQLYRYAKGITVQTIKLKWEFVPNTEKESFQTMFETITTNDFDYTDQKSIAWDARFITGNINFIETKDEKNSSSTYEIGTVSYLSTQRKNSRWTYEIEMEVW